jgi:hypothetical protein
MQQTKCRNTVKMETSRDKKPTTAGRLNAQDLQISEETNRSGQSAIELIVGQISNEQSKKSIKQSKK